MFKILCILLDIFFLYTFHFKLCILTGTNNFFFFFDMSTQEGGWGIRTSDLRFMMRGPQPIELPFGEKDLNMF